MKIVRITAWEVPLNDQFGPRRTLTHAAVRRTPISSQVKPFGLGILRKFFMELATADTLQGSHLLLGIVGVESFQP